MRAADFMTIGAATIRPDASIREAARVMLDHRISGLPVVDEGGNLVGIVSEGDLLREAARGEGAPRHWLETVAEPESPRRAATLAPASTVREVMTAAVVTVSANTPVREVVDLMQRHGIKRVPVVEGNKLVGIVSRADLLRGLAREAELMPGASAEDYALRARVLEALSSEPREGWSSINVLVQNGAIELRGAMSDPTLRQRLVSLAQNIPGVREVLDRLTVVGPASGRT